VLYSEEETGKEDTLVVDAKVVQRISLLVARYSRADLARRRELRE
jgi:hypothetical protein